MKKLGLIVGLCGMIAAVVIAAPYGTQVGTNSVTVMPPRARKGIAWTNPSTNQVGTLVQYGNIVYLVTETSTFTDGSYAPNHIEGVVSNLLAIPSGLREGFAIVNASTNDVWLSVGSDAEVNKGVLLRGIGGSWTVLNVQERINAIAGSESNLVTGVEW